MRFAPLVLLLFALSFARAQDAPPPTRLVRLHFALPPLEGTISLGVYDQNGKLVRVLHREDDISDFTADHDALETTWDGNDDTGHPLPPGRYHAHGFLVAAVKVEGVDDFFNDWVTDETSPHLTHISQIVTGAKMLQLTATAADGKEVHLLFDPATEKLTPTQPAAPEQIDRAKYEGALINPIALSAGKEHSVWAISHVAPGSSALQVVQLSADADGKLAILRTLAIAPNEPQPIALAASPNEDRIFLLEQSPAFERVRSLTLQSTAPAPDKDQAVSDWKVDFEKRIVAHQNFALLNGKPIAVPNDQSKTPETTVQKLRPNPLDRDRPGKVELAVGSDTDGSFLKTVDGLPLRTISDNGQIKRALIAPHGDQAVDIFQDDGAVVEEFRVSQLDQMMAFDCGEFDLK